MITYEIKCRFCGAKTGEMQRNDGDFLGIPVVTPELLGIADSRCTDCENLYGKFPEMEIAYKRDVSKDHQKFKETVEAAGYKAKEFTEEMVKQCPQMLCFDKYDVASIEKHRTKIKTDLGLDGETSEIVFKTMVDFCEGKPTTLDKAQIDVIKQKHKDALITPT